MRCTKYNIGEHLPKYLEKDGFMVPCVPANFERLGVHVRVDAIPEAGKTITKSHGELIDGEWREIIDEQLTQEEIEAATEAAKQAAKPLPLKQAENEYLALLAGLQVTLEPGDNSDTITQKLEASGVTETEALKIGLKLLNAIHEVEIKGGSWYDLPSQPHNLNN